MGSCKYCGKPAGIFRSKHSECKQRCEAARQRIVTEALRAIIDPDKLENLEKTIAEIERTCLAIHTERKALLAKAWEDAVNIFLGDSILDTTEEKRLVEFSKRFDLSQNELDRNGAFEKTVKAAVLRDILNGSIPQRMSVDGIININFQKDEKPVWVFPESKYLEQRTRRQFVGGSRGVSIRIMKGVYYRIGAFKAQPIEYSELVPIDTGMVVVTNRNIYFTGSKKSVRLPYAKIVSFQPYSDGIGVMRDNATAKPQIFVTGDGWFTYNLVVNLAHLA